jgi:N-acetylneuraminic acid mutarotase
MMSHCRAVALAAMLALLWPAHAAVPLLLNFQGRILVGNGVFNGKGQFKFALVSGNGSEAYWMSSVDADHNGQPDSAVALDVSHGLYSVILGNTNLSNMAALPASAFLHDDVRLRVWFNDGTFGFEALSPDQRLTASAYSVVAGTVDSIDASKVTSGVLDLARIPQLPASQIALSGEFSENVIPSLDASKIVSGRLADARLSLNAALKNPDLLTLSNDFANKVITSNAAVSSQISGLSSQLSTLSTGAIDPSRIPNLDASKITTGILNAQRVPPLDAAQISSGVLDPARIPSISANQIAGGMLDPNVIPGMDVSKITGGRFDPTRLPSDVVYRADLLNASNSIVTATIGSLVAQVAFLSDNLTALSSQVANLSNQVAGFTPSSGAIPGSTVVSTLSADPLLVGSGYSLFNTVPAPSWHDGATASAPSARYKHSAAWTGSKWLIWGGLVAGGVDSQQGAEYDPVLDSWNTISTVNPPSSRSGHTAVWTGTEMIVWGGYSGGSYLNTGGRIGVTGAVWTATPIVGAPDGREGHVAVWCAGKMLVWGGRNANGLLNDGAVYDPSVNSWTPLALANPPEARFGASAVWTGDRVLIWGGTGGAGSLASGAQLHFSAGTPASWQPITSFNAPAARDGQSAIWTGNRFIVWGGETDGAVLGSGGSYDPFSNAWQSLPASGSPEARKNHGAVWTGNEMVIFGGENGVAALNSGAAFDPAQNVWRTLSVKGDPLARTEASATWSGTELLVFGGRNGVSPLGALQRLDPQPTWYFYRKQ